MLLSIRNATFYRKFFKHNLVKKIIQMSAGLNNAKHENTLIFHANDNKYVDFFFEEIFRSSKFDVRTILQFFLHFER